MKNRKSSENPWRAAGLVSAIGADLVVCMLLGYFGGAYISERTGGQKMWVVAGLILGLAVGILTVVVMIKKFLEDTNE